MLKKETKVFKIIVTHLKSITYKNIYRRFLESAYLLDGQNDSKDVMNINIHHKILTNIITF